MSCRRYLPLLLLLMAGGCRSAPPTVATTQSLQDALDHYSQLVEGMQSDSIAALFTADGELGAAGQPAVVGPGAIAAHLHTFDQYRVLSERLMVDSSAIIADSGFQRGHYAQTVILPAGDTVTVSGRFTVEWLNDGHGKWRVRRMGTAPAS